MEFQVQNLSDEYSGLISFRIDWFDLLAVQGTLKSFLQHHDSKAPIFQHSAFFVVKLSHSYMTTEKKKKNIALTIQTFIGKVTSLLFNMLSRFVIAFLPRTKHLLISWLQSPSAVILEPKKINSCKYNGNARNIVVGACKFKFCFLKLSKVFFFFQIFFEQQLFEFADVKPVDMEGILHVCSIYMNTHANFMHMLILVINFSEIN